jgi:hypothetical protein
MSLQRYSIKAGENYGPGWAKMSLGSRGGTPIAAAPLPRWPSFPLLKPVISIFAVYEEELNRRRAEFMQEELTRRLGRSFDFLYSWWKLESLSHCKMRQVAADHLAKADIILFSLLSGGELSRTLTKWIEKRLHNRITPKVSLLALLETGGQTAPRLSPSEICLSHIASKTGVDCLCYSMGIPFPRAIRNVGSCRRKRKGNTWELSY